MKKILCAIVVAGLIVMLSDCTGYKNTKDKEDIGAEHGANTKSRFDRWQDSLDVCIYDIISMKDTIEVISIAPLEECALAVNVDKNIEMLNFKYDGGGRYVLDISKSSYATQGQKFSFIITKYKEDRSSFAMTRDEFIEEFHVLAPTLILKQFN